MLHSNGSGIQIALWEEYCHKIFIVVIVIDDCTIFKEGDVGDLFLSSVRGEVLLGQSWTLLRMEKRHKNPV